MRIQYDTKTGEVLGYVEGFTAPDIDLNPGGKHTTVRSVNIHRFHSARDLASDFDRPDVGITPYDFTVIDDGRTVFLKHKSDKRLIIPL